MDHYKYTRRKIPVSKLFTTKYLRHTFAKITLVEKSIFLGEIYRVCIFQAEIFSLSPANIFTEYSRLFVCYKLLNVNRVFSLFLFFFFLKRTNTFCLILLYTFHDVRIYIMPNFMHKLHITFY